MPNKHHIIITYKYTFVIFSLFSVLSICFMAILYGQGAKKLQMQYIYFISHSDCHDVVSKHPESDEERRSVTSNLPFCSEVV